MFFCHEVALLFNARNSSIEINLSKIWNYYWARPGKKILICVPTRDKKINIYLHLKGHEIRLSEQWCCQRIERIKQLYGDWCFCVVRRGQVFSVWDEQTNCAISGHRGQATFFMGGCDCGLRRCNRKSINLSLGRGHVHYEVHILCFIWVWVMCCLSIKHFVFKNKNISLIHKKKYIRRRYLTILIYYSRLE